MNNNKKPTEMVKMATSKLGQKGASAAIKKAAPGINAAEVVIQMVTAYTDWKKVAEEEGTKRHAISAEERRAIHQINVQRDLLMTHLERSFDERRENFRQFFDSLDSGDRQGRYCYCRRDFELNRRASAVESLQGHRLCAGCSRCHGRSRHSVRNITDARSYLDCGIQKKGPSIGCD